MKQILLFLLACYRRVLSPMKPSCCRFYPTCSAYAVEALHIHGAAYGSYLAVRRVLRCHPWGGHGIDPVPPRPCEERSDAAIQAKRRSSRYIPSI